MILENLMWSHSVAEGCLGERMIEDISYSTDAQTVESSE